MQTPGTPSPCWPSMVLWDMLCQGLGAVVPGGMGHLFHSLLIVWPVWSELFEPLPDRATRVHASSLQLKVGAPSPRVQEVSVSALSTLGSGEQGQQLRRCQWLSRRPCISWTSVLGGGYGCCRAWQALVTVWQ